MEENHNNIPDLNGVINEIMNECAHEEEVVHLEPQPEAVATAKPGNQPEVEEPVEEERTAKRQRSTGHVEERESKEEKDFISVEAQDLWNSSWLTKASSVKGGLGN